MRSFIEKELIVCMRKNIRRFIRSHLKTFFTVGFVIAIGVLVFEANAANYYISPTGSDSNSGTIGSPWKTFGFAVPRLKPGDTLFLRDGTYDGSNSGFPNINCGSNASNGTASQPITIKAENERRAYFHGTSTNLFVLTNCSWYVVEGLRLSGPLNDQLTLILWDHVTDSTLRRNLFHDVNNTGANSHAFSAYAGNRLLLEENECYNLTRHCLYLGLGGTNYSIVRRNYANSRNYAQAYTVLATFYPGSNNTAENNIGENIATPVDVQSGYAGSPAVNNKALGNIGLNSGATVVELCRQSSTGRPQNFVARDNVNISNQTDGYGFTFRGGQNIQFDNNTNYSSALFGVGLDNGEAALCTYSGVASLTGKNNLMLSSNVGFSTSQGTWSLQSSVAFGNTTNYSPSSSNSLYSNAMTTNPSLGSCKVFIPTGSPMKGAGVGGADIGANILYRYENGVLTNKPLWDLVTGEFPHGAIVAGVNDIAGSSLFDVHKRLNVNTNGCSFPAGYASGATVTSSTVTKPSTPINLGVSQQSK